MRLLRIATALRAAGLLVLVLMLGSAGALAATVTVFQEPGNKSPGPTYANFSAMAGERNSVRVELRGDAIRFTDSAAEIEPRAGCVQIDAHTAECGRGEPQAFLGDLDDRGSAAVGALYGGPGNDVLDGARAGGQEGNDLVRGTARDDSLAGGPEPDRVIGRAGHDTFGESVAAGDADRIDGGPGLDTVQYLNGPAMLFDLPRGIARGPEAEDTLAGIEAATGGAGTYLGDERRNKLQAFGPAVLRGRAGSDELTTWSDERDDLDGGPGNDDLFLSAFDVFLPARDRIRCGPGSDVVANPSPNTLLPVDCERVRFPTYGGPNAALGGRGEGTQLAAVVWSGACDDDYLAERCPLDAQVHEAVWPDRSRAPRTGALLGSARGTISSARPRLAVEPNRHGRRVLDSGRCVTARLRTGNVGIDDELLVLFQIGRRCRPARPVAP